MATSPSTLLTIPRELRELVYSHLSHAAEFVWRWVDFDVYFRTIDYAFVHVEGAPYPSVLRVHSRLRDEYLDWCLKRVRVSIRFKKDFTWKDDYKPLLHEQSFATKIFSQIRNATVLGELQRWFWYEVGRFLKVFKAKAPHLSTLRIAVTGEPTKGLFPLDSVLNSYTYHENFLAPPLNTLVDLPLVQRTEGYRLQFLPPPWLRPDSPIYPQVNTVPMFRVVEVGAYVYGIRVQEKHFWKAKEVEGSFYIPGCPDYLRHRTDLDIERIDRATQITGWRDKRGEATQNWHDEDPN